MHRAVAFRAVPTLPVMRHLRGAIALATLTTLLATGIATPAAADAYPPPGGRILYQEFDGSSHGAGALKSIRPDGRAAQDLGRQLAWWSSPDYSPDGRRIAFL